MMRNAMIGVCYAVLVIGQICCSNPLKEAARASTVASKGEAEVSSQKAKILEDYRKCLNKNKGDEKACEGYKRAADSM